MPTIATIRQPTYWNLDPFARDEYKAITCPRCNGSGRIDHRDCYKCARHGVVYVKIEKKEEGNGQADD